MALSSGCYTFSRSFGADLPGTVSLIDATTPGVNAIGETILTTEPFRLTGSLTSTDNKLRLRNLEIYSVCTSNGPFVPPLCEYQIRFLGCPLKESELVDFPILEPVEFVEPALGESVLPVEPVEPVLTVEPVESVEPVFVGPIFEEPVEVTPALRRGGGRQRELQLALPKFYLCETPYEEGVLYTKGTGPAAFPIISSKGFFSTLSPSFLSGLFDAQFVPGSPPDPLYTEFGASLNDLTMEICLN